MPYELHPTFVRRLSDGATIPIAEGNRDYNEYLAWVAEGNTPLDPPPPPVVIPQVVSPFQARAALDGWQMLETVEAIMADPATPKITRMAWESAQEFRRTSPTVLQMGAALGLTEAQLDELFVIARGIEA